MQTWPTQTRAVYRNCTGPSYKGWNRHTYTIHTKACKVVCKKWVYCKRVPAALHLGVGELDGSHTQCLSMPELHKKHHNNVSCEFPTAHCTFLTNSNSPRARTSKVRIQNWLKNNNKWVHLLLTLHSYYMHTFAIIEKILLEVHTPATNHHSTVECASAEYKRTGNGRHTTLIFAVLIFGMVVEILFRTSVMLNE